MSVPYVNLRKALWAQRGEWWTDGLYEWQAQCLEIKIAFYDSTFLSSILQFSSGFVKEIEENASAKETRELILYAIYEAAVGWWTWGSWCSSSHHLGPRVPVISGWLEALGRVSQGTTRAQIPREALNEPPGQPNGRPGRAPAGRPSSNGKINYCLKSWQETLGTLLRLLEQDQLTPKLRLFLRGKGRTNQSEKS